MTTPGDTEHDEIEGLLPWYATGRLAPEDMERVAAYLAAHPQAVRNLDAAHQEAAAAIGVSEAIPAPRPDALERLMTSVSAAERRPAASATPGLFARFSSWLTSLSPQQLGYAATAAIMLVIAQTVTLGTVLWVPDSVYRTATAPGNDGKTAAAEFLIGFAPEATMADVSRFLKDNNLTVTGGPHAGLYRVRTTAAGDQAAVIEKLQSSPLVATVLKGR